ncbi:DUF2249 domain-containing protein [Nocardioides sp. AE5]|uniref:DUF2249 domain-containing protein n=1 Tax=Nocardioides sp. AE5 TaxID=2962573 RepID=UPI00288191A1|nr:DUF2249 domain-containing protein [Nocardioides sp. AE5]MDT0200895.1 DUF2249 domain-containing protein [Nocardioides sp. AE5]
MEDLVLASSEADAQAAERIVAHHAEMDGALGLKVDLVTTAARSTSTEAAMSARASLLEWCRELLVPHVRAAEETLCRAGADITEARLLVEAMVVEHRIIADLVEQIGRADDGIEVALHTAALRQLFATHLTKVNDQLVPLLVRHPGVSLAEVHHELVRLVGEARDAGPRITDDGYGHPLPNVEATGEATGHEHGECGCGERDVSGFPELDARVVPHAIRHATVFGALDAVRPGKALVLVAPHDPIPLLRQLEGRQPGVFEVDYLQRGPEDWRLLITRRPG